MDAVLVFVGMAVATWGGFLIGRAVGMIVLGVSLAILGWAVSRL